jgi:hypothetical protein
MKGSAQRELLKRERALEHRLKQQRKRELRRQQKLARKDWDPEQGFGTQHDIRRHGQFGGTLEDYNWGFLWKCQCLMFPPAGMAEKEYAPLLEAAAKLEAKEEMARVARQKAEAGLFQAREAARGRVTAAIEDDPAVAEAKRELAALQAGTGLWR